MKLARKIFENQRQKKNLDGLYEVLAPGNTVCNTSPTTSVIKEPNRQELRVQNSDIAKFGAKAERDTDLGLDIERRPKKDYEKAIEQKINKHRRDVVRINTGDKKINRKRNNQMTSASYHRAVIVFQLCTFIKDEDPKRNPKHDNAFANRPDLTQFLYFSPLMPLAAPPNNPNIAGPSTAQMASPKQPTLILRKSQRKEKQKMAISDTSDSDTSSVRKKKALKRQKKTTTSIVEKIQNTNGYSADILESTTAFIGEVSPRNPNERWTTDRNPNLPREMTVLQAENWEQSDSE